MASFSFPPLLLPPPAVPAVEAVLPVALLEGDARTLPLPEAPAAALPVAPAAPDLAAVPPAMRPDQARMASQLHWSAPEGAALAGSWRAMVRDYGERFADREREAGEGRLSSALLLASQDRDMVRQPDPDAGPLDPWRFAVRPGWLRVVDDEDDARRDGQRQERRRARAALVLDVVLADGTMATVQVEAAPDGIVVTLCAAGADAMRRLRDLHPRLQAAVERAGLTVRAWRYAQALPDAHARLPSADAVAALGLPVFRALAELALTLPA